jgi:hypothetical protein
MAHGRLGPVPQTAKREQFARLIAPGVSNSEACRIVGINRRTGKRWRHGRWGGDHVAAAAARHRPPVRLLALLRVSRYNGLASVNEFASSVAVIPGAGAVLVTGYSLASNGGFADYATAGYDAATRTQLWPATTTGPATATTSPIRWR